ncbi:hypothetical protein NM688_g3272 [Phlebia brevispora]|uniref:Uncharacterized protein n=1 Tax=Phlebia brevispora TaxID=194682 RepID=A0ACC1T6C8_9APHY|nr:hypothetical protein NM688_g3272 [Phlebia brevispora]
MVVKNSALDLFVPVAKGLSLANNAHPTSPRGRPHTGTPDLRADGDALPWYSSRWLLGRSRDDSEQIPLIAVNEPSRDRNPVHLMYLHFAFQKIVTLEFTCCYTGRPFKLPLLRLYESCARCTHKASMAMYEVLELRCFGIQLVENLSSPRQLRKSQECDHHPGCAVKHRLLADALFSAQTSLITAIA